MNKLIYYFSTSSSEGNSSMVDILGTKGANLAQMCNLGLPIPPGFTVSAELCHLYTSNNQASIDQTLIPELKRYIAKLEAATNKTFGKGANPLLISVRSGASVSMPGMMDTILNLGINDQVAEALAKSTSNPCFAYDSYRRFLEMFASVVLGIPHCLFEEILDNYKQIIKVNKDSDLSEVQLLYVIAEYKILIKKYTGQEFEPDPIKQLICAIRAVFKSWTSARATTYRKIHNINGSVGTAVNIQSMVFGNKGNDSSTGVVFTRNPSNGKKEIFGEFLINAQGEDVVSGIRTPLPISIAKNHPNNSMQELMPKQYNQLKLICKKLESHFQNMQDIEFTIEDGVLYILQTRSGKRSAAAAVKIAVDIVNEGLLNKQEALLRIDPESLNQLLHTAIDYSSNPNIITNGLPASPGANTGIAVFSTHDAEELSRHHKVILIRNDTSPEDIKGMHLSVGIITARGGMTSHAAVVARGMGKPCVCGINGLIVNEKQKYCILKSGQKVSQGDTITIDGSNGNLILGNIKLIEPKFSSEFKTLLAWSDQLRVLEVRANAETVMDASVAIKFGASGIGLCRTEHMFFDQDKIPLMREIIIASDRKQRDKAIAKLKPLQIHDFKNLFKIMGRKSINIRLLDPPLHEFLPVEERDIKQLAKTLNITTTVITNRLRELHEVNPMLGHRGCRLGISYPEIYRMQVEAILEAIMQAESTTKNNYYLELMIPLISDVNELMIIKDDIVKTIKDIEQQYSTKFNVKLGTMIELPRAALTADKIASHVEYFSFGSNDLTQTTYGISRDDVNSFLPDYIEKKIFLYDPFTKIDTEGVGQLIKIAIERGRNVNPGLSLGICGEHAGDPQSIDFFHNIGLNYISCSPYRIPIARIAAAQSNIRQKMSIK